ncbi:hypothetical protein OIE66_30755 [Nonomuraea sp. NBC_01738]|uniref:hypothetical protein n=1 Tax=Nonomuraea sp. NBC_01738 TaxID=2976003 RepID=UPI002E11F49B|nr:hypothetical protein OIE66_30755 [Nonomuraea sp. NBC_01738]
MKTTLSPVQEGLLIDAVWACSQVACRRLPAGADAGRIRAYADAIGASAATARAEVEHIALSVRPSSQLGATRLDVRAAVYRYLDH